MFEYEYRSPEQISREAAEHYAHVMAIAERKAEAKRGTPPAAPQRHPSGTRSSPLIWDRHSALSPSDRGFRAHLCRSRSKASA